MNNFIVSLLRDSACVVGQLGRLLPKAAPLGLVLVLPACGDWSPFSSRAQHAESIRPARFERVEAPTEIRRPAAPVQVAEARRERAPLDLQSSTVIDVRQWQVASAEAAAQSRATPVPQQPMVAGRSNPPPSGVQVAASPSLPLPVLNTAERASAPSPARVQAAAIPRPEVQLAANQQPALPLPSLAGRPTVSSSAAKSDTATQERRAPRTARPEAAAADFSGLPLPSIGGPPVATQAPSKASAAAAEPRVAAASQPEAAAPKPAAAAAARTDTSDTPQRVDASPKAAAAAATPPARSVSALSSSLPLPSIGGPPAPRADTTARQPDAAPAAARTAETKRADENRVAARPSSPAAAERPAAAAIQEIITGPDESSAADLLVAQEGTPRPDPIAPGSPSMPTFRDTPPPTAGSTAPVQRATGQDRSYPNLATVPPRPQGLQTPDELRALRERLERDRSDAAAQQRSAPTGPRSEVAPNSGEPQATTAPLPRRGDADGSSLPSSASVRTADRSGSGPGTPVAATSSAARAASPSVSILAAWLSFANDSKRLTDEDRRIVREVAALYQKQGGRLRVVGDTETQLAMAETQRDRSRNAEADRARDIAQELIRSGVKATDGVVTATDGAGPEIVPRSDGAGANERRVHIYLDY